MKALADRATPEEQEDAWFDAAIAEAAEREAAGRPGGTIPHELVVAEMKAAWRLAFPSRQQQSLAATLLLCG